MTFLDDLNPVQREAVQAVDGPVMIVAGAGSGKTRVLTYRIAYLLQRGVKPESVLALTFTNKAADEMKGRISTLVGEPSRSLWMGTFHSVFARILRWECEKIGFARNFSIYDADDTLSLIKNVMTSLAIPQQQYAPAAIRARISMAKNQMLSPKAYRESGVDPMTEKTAAVFEEYERKLKQSNAMDFDDLLLKPLDIFSRHPDVLQRYTYRFKYILVDEYQDTNRVQYRLINTLASVNKNICVVGDDAQSIYAFRGADIRNILDFERDYPGCRIFRLEQNYRSTKSILEAAGSLIVQNRDQIAKNLWTANLQGDPVTLEVSADDREEGYRVVARIEAESRSRKLDLKDFAVLYRTNAQSRVIEDALRRSSIPYVIVVGVAFYKRKEIKDILAYLKVIANPTDDESLLRIINFPARAIGDSTVKKIKELREKRSRPLFEVIGSRELGTALPEKAVRAVQRFHALLQKYLDLKETMSVGELTRALVDELGVLRDLKEENTPDSLARRENIQELVSALSEFTTTHPDARLEEFLEEVSLVSDIDMTEFGHNAVTLMTLHAAKGLEFPVVFITGLEEGLFPISGAADDRAAMEEERRLFYVGITRAMQKLYLMYAVTRYQYGEPTYTSKSRFLDEIEAHLVPAEGVRAGTRQRAYRRPVPSSPLADGSRMAVRQKATDEDARTYSSDPMPNYEDESQDENRVAVGTRVVHEAFGRGRVIALDGRGENARAIVDFETVGRKHLMLKFAHLRIQ